MVLLGTTFLCVHASLPQRPTLPASLPLTQTVPLRFEDLCAGGNIICSLVSDSFRPLVVVAMSLRDFVISFFAVVKQSSFACLGQGHTPHVGFSWS